jgi:hypothetical protein
MGPGQANASQTQVGATLTAQAQTGSSDSQIQIEALVKRIQAAMTADQLQAIAAMQLTQDSVMAILKDQGITIGAPAGGAGNRQAQPVNPLSGNDQAQPGNPPSSNGQAPQGRLPSGNGQAPAQGTPQTGNAQANPDKIM